MHKTSGKNRTGVTLALAVFRVLKALAKFTLKHGMSIGAMTELVRRAYLEAATELLIHEHGKVTTSQICAMTGMYRKEVRRLEQLPEITDTATDDKYNRSSRVVTGWLRDAEFNTKAGKPAALSPDGENGFDALVRQYSGDMTPTAMRRELERLGIITISSRGLIKLNASAYLSASEADGMQILGTDTAELIETINRNLSSPESKRFQRKVFYTDIPADKAADFYRFAEKESQKLLEKLDRRLAQMPTSRRSEDNPLNLGVGIYHIENQGGKKGT